MELLEFEEIRSRVAEYCLSDEGRALLADQEISVDSARIDEYLIFSGEVRRLIEAEPLPPLDFPPVRDAMPKYHKSGTVADGPELAAVGAFIQSAMELQRFLTREHGAKGLPAAERLPPSEKLSEFASSLPDLGAVAGRIRHLLNPDGTVNEDRVPELKAIRREMQRLHGEIETLTSRYLSSDRAIWQAEVPTQRDGRTVLPLKADYRGRISGIVHEVSATGATLFIEPMDIVERNNQLVERDNRYRREVHRILGELTGLVRERVDEIEGLIDSIARFDTMYARARYASGHSCNRAARSERRIVLRRARHPLLGKEAVPLDFELGESATVMVITGANAGGKTVSLKTVGLLVLMNQWGLEIPAAEGSELPVLARVLVDIGDDQSIANSLSTFSGHMKALSTIIERSDSSSLVLLDEIGSGTDPSEGSALAMAVLDHLLEAGALVVATTHHGIIKRYGYSKPGIINASVTFDSATLSPTYELVIGVPGESHALEIASRSRIAPPILERARGYFEQQRTDLDRAVEELAARSRELDERAERVAETARNLESEREELAAKEESLEGQQRKLRDKEYGELKAFLLESRRDLENLVRELRTGEITREKTRKVKTYINNLEQKLADEEREPVAEQRAGASKDSIEPGSEVYVGKNRRRGTVLRKERGDKWLVMVNTLRMSIPSGELVPARSVSTAEKRHEKLSVEIAGAGESIRPALELDLRGMRLEEALESLERQLDRAIISGLTEFSVIHGKGEGVLREGVHRLLSDSSAVSDFYFSPPESGGYGKTIVKLGST